MRFPNNDRLEELLVGLATDNLTSSEEDELRLLTSNNELIKDTQDYYILLKSNLEILPSEKVPIALKTRLISNSQKIEKRARKASIFKTLLLLLAGFSGSFLIENNNRNFQLAIKDADQTPNVPNQTIHNYSNQDTIKNAVFNLSPPANSIQTNSLMNASLVIRPDKATNLLKVNGLPPLPEGFTYRLWAFTNKGSQGCVSFHPNKLGQVIMNVPSEPTKSALNVSITIDKVIPGFGPEKPGDPVLISI